MIRIRRTIAAARCLGFGLALVAAGGAGGAFTWNGNGGNDLFTNGLNWDTGTAPMGSVLDNLVFGVETGNFQVTGQNAALTDVTGISFTGANGSYTIGGSGSFAISDAGVVRNDSALLQTINVDLVGTGANLELFADQGALMIGGDVDLSDTGGVLLTVRGDRNTTIAGQITGAGGNLDKVDNGTLTLTASNTYDGLTSIVAGTVVAGHDNAFGTSVVQVTGDSALQSSSDSRVLSNVFGLVGSTLTISGSNDLTVNGPIGGSGILKIDFVSGVDRLTLNSGNSYSGGTQLRRGTLILGHDNALGTGALTVSLSGVLDSDADGRMVSNDVVLSSGAVLDIAGSTDMELLGNISGSGALVKEGAKTLVLSGTNTYSGLTSVMEGTLRLENGAAIDDAAAIFISNTAGATLDLMASETVGMVSGGGAAGGTISLNANTLSIAGTTTGVFAGTITGTGSLHLTGAADLTLSGANTYSGVTTISGAGATLGLGDDAALGTSTLVVNAAATLRSSGGDRTIANAITLNTTDLTLAGSTSLTLAGAVDLSGMTVALDVTNTAGVDIGGVISNGGLTKTGAGTLTLSGVNTYAGDTNIDGGTLSITGSVAGDVLANTGGTLGGTGMIGGTLTAGSGSTISPGTAAGEAATLTVGGNYVQQTGSTLAVDVNAQDGTSDLLDVAGSATLESGSTINATIASPTFIQSGQTFTILQAAGGITDDGTTITTTSATMSFILQRSSAFVNGMTAYILEAFRAAGAYEAAAVGENNQRIGQALNDLVPIANANPGGDAAMLLGLLDPLDSVQLNQAIKELSPEPYNAATSASLDTVQAFNSTQASYLASKRAGADAVARDAALSIGMLASAGPDPAILASAIAAQDDAYRESIETASPLGAYVRGFGILSRQDTEPNRTGYDAHIYGAQGGIDYTLAPGLIAGVAFGYAQSDADLDGNLGSFDTESFRVGPYLTRSGDGWYVDASLTVGFNQYDNTRNIPTLGLAARSKYDGMDFTGYLGAGYEFELDNAWTLTPTVALQYSYLDLDGYQETGAGGANLTVSSRDTDSLRARVGAALTIRLDDGSSPTFLDLRTGFEHEFLENADIEAAFTGGGNAFSIDTGNRDEDSFYFGVGVTSIIRPNMTAFLRYEGLFSNTSDVHGITGGVSLRF